MKHILMIGTGGTIASEMTPEGLTPELNTRQLLSFVPRIGELCHVDCIQVYSLDSTNLQPKHWLGVAETIRNHYEQYDGFVISHGTDTMAYTAAAHRADRSAKAHLVRRHRLQAEPDRCVSLRLPGLRRRADRL